MSENPPLSVVIASYNSSKTIESCLKSLEKQTTQEPFEVIVVDSSIDGTGEMVEKKFPYVKVLRFRERKFPGDARNIGIAEANGKIIAFIDADCKAEEHWAEEIIKAHQAAGPAFGVSERAGPTQSLA